MGDLEVTRDLPVQQSFSQTIHMHHSSRNVHHGHLTSVEEIMPFLEYFVTSIQKPNQVWTALLCCSQSTSMLFCIWLRQQFCRYTVQTFYNCEKLNDMTKSHNWLSSKAWTKAMFQLLVQHPSTPPWCLRGKTFWKIPHSRFWEYHVTKPISFCSLRNKLPFHIQSKSKH